MSLKREEGCTLLGLVVKSSVLSNKTLQERID